MGRARRQKPRRLAEKLQEIRNRLDLSQTQIIKRLGSVAETLQSGHISEIESGTREPSLLVLLQYARIAGVPMEALVDDDIDLPEYLPSELLSEWIMVRRESKIQK